MGRQNIDPHGKVNHFGERKLPYYQLPKLTIQISRTLTFMAKLTLVQKESIYTIYLLLYIFAVFFSNRKV